MGPAHRRAVRAGRRGRRIHRATPTLPGAARIISQIGNCCYIKFLLFEAEFVLIWRNERK